jgi:hypothetical protein
MQLVQDKLVTNRLKYLVETARGSSKNTLRSDQRKIRELQLFMKLPKSHLKKDNNDRDIEDVTERSSNNR